MKQNMNVKKTVHHLDETIAVYNAIAPAYAANIEEYYDERVRTTFVSLIPKEGIVLDVGCAAGRDSRYFDSLGFRVIGIDLSEKLLEIAKQKSPHIDYRLLDVRRLDYPADYFDGIYASAILLHLNRDELKSVSKLFFQMVKPGGVVCLLVKEGAGEGYIKETLSDGKARYFTFFHSDEIRSVLEQHGFIIKTLQTFNEQEAHPDHRDINWIMCICQKP
jgi:SAM-dependent methyltransferase